MIHHQHQIPTIFENASGTRAQVSGQDVKLGDHVVMYDLAYEVIGARPIGVGFNIYGKRLSDGFIAEFKAGELALQQDGQVAQQEHDHERAETHEDADTGHAVDPHAGDHPEGSEGGPALELEDGGKDPALDSEVDTSGNRSTDPNPGIFAPAEEQASKPAAEAAPKVKKPPRGKDKGDDVAIYFRRAEGYASLRESIEKMTIGDDGSLKKTILGVIEEFQNAGRQFGLCKMNAVIRVRGAIKKGVSLTFPV